MRILICIIFSIVILGCAKAPPPEFTYNSNINSVVVVQHQFGMGTGFYLGNGIIATASHVVPTSMKMQVWSQKAGVVVLDIPLEFTAEDSKGNIFKMTKLYDSPNFDISFMRIEEGHNLVPVILAENVAEIGDKIFMISHPANFNFSYTEGYVVNIPILFEKDEFAMMHNIGRFYGSSGAGIFSEEGEIVGLMNALLPDSSIAIGHTVEAIKLALKEMGDVKTKGSLP